MDRKKNLVRNLYVYMGATVWIFLLLSIISFRPTDFPSPQIYPAPPIHNLCGKVGAFIAYYLFYTFGPGVYPIMVFAGVCYGVRLFRNAISDLWLRIIGLIVLSVALASFAHLVNPGSPNTLAEGSGGILGISTANFLRDRFSIAGTVLILLASFVVGLILAADELVAKTPILLSGASNILRIANPSDKIRSFSKLITNIRPLGKSSGKTKESASSAIAIEDTDGGPIKPATVLRQNRIGVGEKISADQTVNGQTIEFSYENDHPVQPIVEAVTPTESDAPPAESAVIPPVEEQAVVTPPPVINAHVAMPQPPNPEDIVVRSSTTVKPKVTEQPPQPKALGNYILPSWENLSEAEHGYAEEQERYVREKAVELESALKQFGLDAKVVAIDTGPVITMYEILLAPGVRVAAVTQLSNDIARALMATTVRIVAPVPGKDTVGVEVPNPKKEKVRLKELMQLAPEAQHKMQIPLFLGKDASGEPLVADLTAMPHCLIAGTTGSGKSVCINSIIMSILYTQRPDMVKMILVDPKVVEMAPFKDIPHLMCPVINDTGRATSVLEWACTKMDERYEFLAEAGVRNIAGYNKLTQDELNERFKPSSPEEEAKIPKFLPYIVIIIDELADLMMTSGKEVEQHVVRLAQKSRAVGIHLILATQRPQANVVTGLIKSNMPTRVAFRVNSRMDSRIVLDQNGADLLLGQGDMLFLPPGVGKPIRSQGTFIDDKEIRESVRKSREQADAQYEPELVQIRAKIDPSEIQQDDMFDDAVRVVLETKRGSVSLLQRRMSIGYGRASRLIEMMASSGILGDYKGSQAREVTMTVEEWDVMRAQMKKDHDDGMTV